MHLVRFFAISIYFLSVPSLRILSILFGPLLCCCFYEWGWCGSGKERLASFRFLLFVQSLIPSPPLCSLFPFTTSLLNRTTHLLYIWLSPQSNISTWPPLLAFNIELSLSQVILSVFCVPFTFLLFFIKSRKSLLSCSLYTYRLTLMGRNSSRSFKST